MSPRPAIFISAVSCELRSARQLVANTLTFLGYEPEWQDIFGTEEGDLRAILRRRIDSCKGVVQLVGKCYGAEPPSIDEQFGGVSYTQYEALYASSKGKKVWFLFLDESFPSDPHEEEGEEKEKLQSAYRARLKADVHLYHPLGSREGLEASVLKLRDDLTRLRRGVRRWAALVAVLLVLIFALSIWLLRGQQALQEKFDKLQQGVNSFAEVQNKVRRDQAGQKPEEIEQRTYEVLGKQLGIDAATLKEQLPRFAAELKKSPNATTYERANAAYVAKDYNEAERLALAAAAEAQRSSPAKNAEAVEAFELAGWAAEKRIEYADALKRLHDAEALTDVTRDPLEWARVQFAIAWVLIGKGQYNDAESILLKVLKEREPALGPEHPDTLNTRNALAKELYFKGKYAEAEAECRAVLKVQEKVLGPEHPDTLSTRTNLALALDGQCKYAEAEAEDRVVIKLKEKVLGPEHPETLGTRIILVLALDNEGKYAEAEAQGRAVLKLEEKVLGPEHPNTLELRNFLADALGGEGKYTEAEAESRTVIKLEEKVLGLENPITLGMHSSLADALNGQGKYADAEAEYRSVIKLEEKVLGPEHASTLNTRASLPDALEHEGKYAEAEAECRAVIKLEEKVLGPEDRLTLDTRTSLADALDHQCKDAEAEAECRAVLKLEEKALGPEHPDTLTTRHYLANALEHEGKYAEAEAEYRAVLKLREKVLGPEHPGTLSTCFRLARCLRDEDSNGQARELAQRAADGASKVLGPEHPDTKKYEQLLKELVAKED
ncbi:MAG: tetratricopeptide repeat protein [Chthoniobacterales bacterium]